MTLPDRDPVQQGFLKVETIIALSANLRELTRISGQSPTCIAQQAIVEFLRHGRGDANQHGLFIWNRPAQPGWLIDTYYLFVLYSTHGDTVS